MDREALVETLAALEFAVLERVDGGCWRVCSVPPRWLAQTTKLRSVERGAERELLLLRERATPFLASFLDEAERAWLGGREQPLDSGIWIETTPDGREWPLRASAIDLAARAPRVVVEWLGPRYEELAQVLQRGRERALDREALDRETSKKEVLLHCIVHDLKAPLAGVVGALSLLRGDATLDSEQRELARMALDQAKKQLVLIEQMLDVFAADLGAIDAFDRDPEVAPDLIGAAAAAADTLRAATPGERSRIQLAVPAGRLPVHGKTDRLERVLVNLIENALRHAPERTPVRVVVIDEGASGLVAVDDRGPGVSAELEPHLFDAFVRGGGGGRGLGLYYCKLTIDAWGGQIGYQRRSPEGSRFWFRLPKALAEKRD